MADSTLQSGTCIRIGVLALQGAFIEHVNLLQQAASLVSRKAKVPQSGLGGQTHDTFSGRKADPASDNTIPAEAVPATLLEHDDVVADDQHEQGPSSFSGSVESSGVEKTQSTLSRNETSSHDCNDSSFEIDVIQVRTPADLSLCSALIIPGGESTSISLIASRTGLLEPLRHFVKVLRRPTWGTCAGLILLAESANRTKATGQELIGGLDVRVQRNYFGRQVESFEAELECDFLGEGEEFHAVFIRAPVVEAILPAGASAGTNDVSEQNGADRGLEAVKSTESTVTAPVFTVPVFTSDSDRRSDVEVLARLPGRARALRDQTTTAEELGEDGDIVAVRQRNVFGTAFHPELTGDGRIHAWWLAEVVKDVRKSQS